MTSIPLFATSLEPHRDRIVARLAEVVAHGRFILGPEVEAFERDFAAYLGVPHVVGVGNGTDALTICLRAAGIGPGDEVVCPSLTFYATAESIVNAGATPVFCEVDPDTYCLTAETVRPRLTSATKAIAAVHLFGNVAPVGELRELGLPVLEDAAQAAGATLGGVKAGALGDAATFSFFPSKNLGGFGDGGAVVTSDPEVEAIARRLRFHGSTDKTTHTEAGYNSRLDELQAAALRVLLPHLDEWTAARRAVAQGYRDAGLGDRVAIQAEPEDGASCWHLFVVRTPERDELRGALAEAGIGARPYYELPLYRQPAVERWAPPEPLPEVERVCAEILALPMGTALDAEAPAKVAEAVGEVLAAKA